jgi:hypothetical protein
LFPGQLNPNADGLRNLLVWARTGVETPMYPSIEQRNADSTIARLQGGRGDWTTTPVF